MPISHQRMFVPSSSFSHHSPRFLLLPPLSPLCISSLDAPPVWAPLLLLQASPPSLESHLVSVSVNCGLIGLIRDTPGVDARTFALLDHIMDPPTEHFFDQLGTRLMRCLDRSAASPHALTFWLKQVCSAPPNTPNSIRHAFTPKNSCS